MERKEASARAGARPGGRAARIQAAVYGAVKKLQTANKAENLSVQAIAQEAGVNPTTIYRRWGTLGELLSDIALQKLLPDSEPEDTGKLREDFKRWLEEYVDELATETGRNLLRDIAGAAGDDSRLRCQQRHQDQIETIRLRALERGESPPEAHEVMDQVIAPIVYRILFTQVFPDFTYAWKLMSKLL